MDRWLFLNATANPTDVSVDQNSIITFKLDSYDNSSGEIKSYDASKMKFILDFTQTLGELDKTSALIGENITYTARQGGNSGVTGKYETGSYTIELNNVKIPTEINVTDSTIALNAGGEADVGATLTPADAGNLTYSSNNTNVVVVENGKIKAHMKTKELFDNPEILKGLNLVKPHIISLKEALKAKGFKLDGDSNDIKTLVKSLVKELR